MPKYQKIIRQVEEEEGQPFWDVVRDYAEMGCSKSETARLLGFKWPTYFLMLLRENPEQSIEWVSPSKCVLVRDMRERCATPGSEDHQRLIQASKKAIAKNTKRYWIDDVYDSVAGHLARLNPTITVDTVRSRMKRGRTLEQAIREPKIAAEISGKRSAANRKRKCRQAA